MRKFLVLKFDIPELRQQLINTGTESLVEGNDYKDSFWGVYRGKGKNWLGMLIMQIRFEII